MTIPPYRRIAWQIRDQIVGGVYQPGDRLPSTRALVEAEGVAKATVDKVFRVLRDENLVESRPGVGLVVRDHRRVQSPRDMFLRTTGLDQGIRLKNETSEFLHCGLNDAPPTIADLLGIPHNAKAVCRQRLISRSQRPVMMATSWFPESYKDTAPRLVKREPIPEGTPRYVSERLGLALDEGHDEVESVAVPFDMAQGLGIPLGTPVMQITSRITATDGTVVEVGGYTMVEGMQISYDYKLTYPGVDQ